MRNKNGEVTIDIVEIQKSFNVYFENLYLIEWETKNRQIPRYLWVAKVESRRYKYSE